MTPTEVKRFELLKKVLLGKVSLVQATPGLGVSYRQAKRLKREVRERGLAGLVHGNRERAPSNKREPELREQVLALAAGRYSGCNDSHFAELLGSEEGIGLSRETVRKWRREAGIRPKRKRRAPKHRSRRPRKAAEGLMGLWDGSFHPWFGPDFPACCLMAAMDDATGKVLALRFVPVESSWAYLKLLEMIVRNWGVPASIYQDCHGALRRNDGHWSQEEELAGKQEPTQVGAALEALGTEPIFALSAQAKGRIERLFGTLQDRLVAELALAGVTDIAGANAFLAAGFLEAFNAKFAHPAPAEPVWRPAPKSPELTRILSLCYQATVGADNAVRIAGQVIDLPPGPHRRSYARCRVEVRQMLDGSWRVYLGDQVLASAPATEIAERVRTRQRRKGVRAAFDYEWRDPASSPTGSPPPTSPKPPANGRAAPPSFTLRRARPGHAIGATRIA